MKNFEEKIKAEMERIVDLMANTHPATEDYTRLITSYERLSWIISGLASAAHSTDAGEEVNSDKKEEPTKLEPVKQTRKGKRVKNEEPVAEEPAAEEPVTEEPVTEEPVAEIPFSEVKECAATISADGKRDEVKALIAKYTDGKTDVDGKSLPKKLSSMDPKDYPAFMQELKALKEEE